MESDKSVTTRIGKTATGWVAYDQTGKKLGETYTGHTEKGFNAMLLLTGRDE